MGQRESHQSLTSKYGLDNMGLEVAIACLRKMFVIQGPQVPGFIRAVDNVLAKSALYAEVVEVKTGNRIGAHKAMVDAYDHLVGFMRSLEIADLTASGTAIVIKHVIGDNVLRIGETLARGTFGKVLNGELNGTPVVLKTPLNPTVLELRNFLEENLLHALLFCFHDLICQAAGVPDLPQFVPSLRLVSSLRVNNGPDTMIVVMNKLDGNAHRYAQDMAFAGNEDALFDMLAQVAQLLYFMQKYVGFHHRDLHGGNIMFLRRPQKSVTRVFIPEVEDYVLPSHADMFIADFGQCCVKFNCCNMPTGRVFPLEDPSGYYRIYDPKVAACGNNSHDLRIFMRNILDTNTTMFFKVPQFIGYLREKFVDTGVNHWHETYNMYGNDDPSFYPTTVLKDIRRLRHVTSGTSVTSAKIREKRNAKRDKIAAPY